MNYTSQELKRHEVLGIKNNKKNLGYGDWDLGKLTHFSQLEVWQLSKVLTLHIYKCTSKFPQSEKFGLVSQLRRASVSIVSNIAEGFGRILPKDKSRFYVIARGSLDEIECQLMVSHELNMLNKQNFDFAVSKIISIKKMLNALIKKQTYKSNSSSYTPNPKS